MRLTFSWRSALCTLLLGAVLLLPSPRTAEGYVYKVKSGGTGDGSSWEKALGEKGLLEKLATAGYGHEFWIAAGTYRPYIAPEPSDSTTRGDDQPDPREHAFVLNRGVALYGGFAGTETSRSQRDWKRNPLCFQGTSNCREELRQTATAWSSPGTTWGFPQFWTASPSREAKQTGKRLLATADMRILDSSPQITNCTFSGNQATRGGVYVSGGAQFSGTPPSQATRQTSRAAFSTKRAAFPSPTAPFEQPCSIRRGDPEQRAGDRRRSPYSSNTTATITKSTFSGNNATESGGAIANWICSPASRIFISANRSLVGGARYSAATVRRF